MAITSDVRNKAYQKDDHHSGRLPKRVAMTMTSAGPSLGADGVQFTPEVIEEIKDLVAQGISRDEIASRLGVSVGYLQVTCLRLGISLRRIILPNGSGRHTADCAGARAEGITAADSPHHAFGAVADVAGNNRSGVHRSAGADSRSRGCLDCGGGHAGSDRLWETVTIFRGSN
jgi:hypothetical protein